jgi:hypothetical protein
MSWVCGLELNTWDLKMCSACFLLIMNCARPVPPPAQAQHHGFPAGGGGAWHRLCGAGSTGEQRGGGFSLAFRGLAELSPGALEEGRQAHLHGRTTGRCPAQLIVEKKRERDATAERRDAQDEFHSAAQARAWADGDFDADHGFAFDGVGRPAH